jgi:hypothetical protein
MQRSVRDNVLGPNAVRADINDCCHQHR